MNNSGDSAEQIVRMSLEGVEIAAKITGSAAKNIAAMLYSILKNKDKNKIKGRARLTSMLKSGKELKVFTVSEKNLKQFMTQAKKYGVVYCALRNKKANKDGLVDVLVRAEDASKINRIVERFKLSAVDTATIKNEIEKTKGNKAAETAEISETAAPEAVNDDALLDELLAKPDPKETQPPEKAMPTKSKDDILLDDVMGKPQQKEQSAPQNPQTAKTEKSPPSEPTLKKQGKTAEGTTKSDKPSVLGELKAIKTEQKEKAEMPAQDKAISNKPTPSKTPEHKQPTTRKKNKNKSKGR